MAQVFSFKTSNYSDIICINIIDQKMVLSMMLFPSYSLFIILYMAMNERLIDSYRIMGVFFFCLNEDINPSFAFKLLSSFIIAKYTCRIILSVIIYGDNINHKSHPCYNCWLLAIFKLAKMIKILSQFVGSQWYNEKETK